MSEYDWMRKSDEMDDDGVLPEEIAEEASARRLGEREISGIL